jgi:hypothetical protein
MKTKFIFLSLIFVSKMLLANDSLKVSIIGGYGYYEATFIGLKYQGYKKRSWLLGTGYNFNLHKAQYNSVFIEHQLPITKWKGEPVTSKKVEVGLGLEAMYWRQSDKYLIWGNMGLSPNIYGLYHFNQRVSLAASVGPQFNFNLYNERKNYLKTGWIKRRDINFKFTLEYVF